MLSEFGSGGRQPLYPIDLMASRKEQKEAARQRRLAEEQAAQAKAQRTRRLQLLGGVGVVAVIGIAVLVVISVGGGSKSPKTLSPSSPGAKTLAASVNDSLKGIHQSGNTLGNPKAKVTMTEFGDLECPICKEFAVGPEAQLIKNEVKQGTVKLVYKSFPTATNDLKDTATIFPLQQDAAYAAGAQNKAWNYILLFYHEQGTEDTPYVDTSYLTTLAKQVPGLDVSKWNTDRFNPTFSDQVVSEEQQATKLGIKGTPGIMFSGAKSQTKLYSGLLSYSDLQGLIKSVS
jgi:protein-disulfide isomerase